MYQKIKENQYDEICNLYLKQKSSEKIAKLYNVDGCTICNILKKKNIKLFNETSRTDFFNQNLFENGILNKELAYILGLLYADGCNTRESIRLSLQEEDKYILEKIKKIFNKEKELIFIKKKKPHHKFRYDLALYSKKLSRDLKNLGMVEAKSLILKFPDYSIVPKEFMGAFIRGYFDGDGCVYISKKNKMEVSITSSPFFCEDISKYLFDTLNIKNNIRSYKNSNAKTVKIRNINDCKRFFDFIYKDKDDLFLIRKFTKFALYFNDRENKLKIKENIKVLNIINEFINKDKKK